MSIANQEVRDLITQQAADWLLANCAGLSERERGDFAHWLEASPAHIEEYLALALIGRDLKEACAGAETVDALIALAKGSDDSPSPLRSRELQTGRANHGTRRSPWRTGFALAAALCLGLGIAWYVKLGSPQHEILRSATLHFQTGHGEQQTHSLPDGSILHLNTDTALLVTLSGAERKVVLAAGEADFEVAHDPKRLFRVIAGTLQIIDAGTQFDVRLKPDAALITVIQGRVAVAPASVATPRGTSDAALLRAGFVVVVSDHAIAVPQGKWPVAQVASDGHSTTSWLRRQISFEHEPLSQVAGEFNRYSSKRIEIATPSLNQMKISGVFSIDDMDAFIAFLRSIDGVRVEVSATRILVSRD